MEPRPRTRLSRELPPDFSDLMNKVTKSAASFIKQFDNNEPEMRKIVTKMEMITEELKKVQEITGTMRKTTAVLTGIGILAAPFTGGLSLAVAAGVAGTNTTKIILEKQSIKEVEDLGRKFKKIIEPLEQTLKEIKTTCEKLEEKYTKAQTENTLRDMADFKWILRRISELKERSQEAVDVAVVMMQKISNLLVLIVAVFRVTPTPEEDQKLRAAIIQSADQSQKVITKFESMKEALREFTGN